MRYLWYSLYAFATSLAIYALFFSPRSQQPAAPPPVATPVEQPAPDPVTATPETVQASSSSKVEIALLLDTSSSMDGLIEQARVQLWEIVSSLQSDDSGTDRSVSVALYQYGNSRLSERSGYIEMLSELTPELDLVSVKLHSLSTSGGREYAPEAITKAVEQLAWSDDDSVDKLIVIAGNESFDQGPVRPRDALAHAAAKQIKVLTVFCANGGSTSAGMASWHQAAALANTELEVIDSNQVVAKVESPYDAAIVARYEELAATRLTYGDADYRQEVESANYTISSKVAQESVALGAERAIASSRQKGGADLTADFGKNVDIGSLKESELPTALQGLSEQQRVEEIKTRQAKRVKLQREIDKLSKQRKGHLSSQPAASQSSLGRAVSKITANEK